MIKDFNFNSKGYIALTATLIISFIMFSMVLATSSDGFRVLISVWQRHSKELSFNLAESCLDQAIVRVLQNPNYQPLGTGEIINIENFSCLIKQVERDGYLITIKTEAEVNKAFTSLKAVFDETKFSVVSLKEVSE